MLFQINGLPGISIAWAPPEPLRYFCGFEFLIVSHLQHEHMKLAVKDFRSNIQLACEFTPCFSSARRRMLSRGMAVTRIQPERLLWTA
jgi:hypothetical protein